MDVVSYLSHGDGYVVAAYRFGAPFAAWPSVLKGSLFCLCSALPKSFCFLFSCGEREAGCGQDILGIPKFFPVCCFLLLRTADAPAVTQWEIVRIWEGLCYPALCQLLTWPGNSSAWPQWECKWNSWEGSLLVTRAIAFTLPFLLSQR